MANKFYVVSGMARFDAIDADGITVCRVAGLAPEIDEMKLKHEQLIIPEMQFVFVKFCTASIYFIWKFSPLLYPEELFYQFSNKNRRVLYKYSRKTELWMCTYLLW